MSCNFLNFKDCQIKGSTFSSVKFNFPGRDISGDSFFMLLKDRPQRRVNGIIVENEVLFPYESFQDLMIGRYVVEFWADFADIGLKAIARQELEISEAGKASKCCEQTGAVFGLNTGDIVVEYSISLVVINLREGGEVQWDEIEGKPTVFYDDTEIKEELAEKVDKVEGFGLSENNFSDADVEKLGNLENFDPTDINNALGNKVDKIEGKGLSTNDYTTAEKNKLAGLDGNKFFGKFADETALNAVVGIIGGYAYVGAVGRNDESYIWDDDDNKWVKSNNIPTAETPASVKLKYESNANTNAFTNAHKLRVENSVTNTELPSANVGSATKLQASRIINGVSFDGTQSITTNVWGNARNITIGNSTKAVNGSANVSWTLAEIGAEPLTSQYKNSTNLLLDSFRNKSNLIATANITITVPSNLPDNFECTFIADGGTITFANSGTTFKFNNSKVLLASGGIATLRKENGTNNFYLKGDLS